MGSMATVDVKIIYGVSININTLIEGFESSGIEEDAQEVIENDSFLTECIHRFYDDRINGQDPAFVFGIKICESNYGNLLCSVRLSDSDIEDLDSEFEEYANELQQKFGVQISTGYPELICGATLS